VRTSEHGGSTLCRAAHFMPRNTPRKLTAKVWPHPQRFFVAEESYSNDERCQISPTGGVQALSLNM
jgi:hypothetical protein